VLGATSGETAQHLLGLGRAQAQGGGVLDQLVVLAGDQVPVDRAGGHDRGDPIPGLVVGATGPVEAGGADVLEPGHELEAEELAECEAHDRGPVGVEQPVGDEANVDAVQGGAECLGHGRQAGGDLGEALQDPSVAQVGGVVGDRLDAEDVLAFGVGLQRQASEVDLEHGQVVTRCIDHGLQSRWPAGPVAVGTCLGPEQRPHRGHVQARACPIDHGVEDTLHLGTVAEQQVAAVLHLVHRVGVAEAASPLFVGVQGEAQTGAVDPPVAHLAQSPYCPGLGHGVCDLSQAHGVRDGGEAVALLDEPATAAACAAQPTYSWPLRITCTPNGGCPDIFTVTWPQSGSMMWNE
jgi:hypothetical protein